MTEDILIGASGTKYKIVGSTWIKLLTGLCVLNFMVLMGIIAGLIDNIQRVEATMQFTDKVGQRNQALNDIAGSRATANIWAFDKTCELIKKQGGDCLANPQWYADPKRYPLIADDPAGAGLFPPK